MYHYSNLFFTDVFFYYKSTIFLKNVTNLVENLQVCCGTKWVFCLFSHMANAVARD